MEINNYNIEYNPTKLFIKEKMTHYLFMGTDAVLKKFELCKKMFIDNQTEEEKIIIFYNSPSYYKGHGDYEKKEWLFILTNYSRLLAFDLDNSLIVNYIYKEFNYWLTPKYIDVIKIFLSNKGFCKNKKNNNLFCKYGIHYNTIVELLEYFKNKENK